MKKSTTQQMVIDQLKNETEEWKNKYLRALADYQNLEKRIAVQKQEWVESAFGQVIKKVLPVLDILEKADEHLKDQGLSLGIKQLRDVLASEQVEKIDVLGKKFDPREMECIEVVASEEDDEVVGEIQSGYKIKGEVVRVAKVKVGKKKIPN